MTPPRPQPMSRATLFVAFIAVCATLWAPAVAMAADEEPPFRLSLPTIEDHKAWLLPGFRLQLGYAKGNIWGLSGVPDGSTGAAVLRFGARLDEQWSVMSTFVYAASSGGVSGLRFMGTIDPTWHVTERFSVAVGAGFGGLIEPGWTRDDPEAELNQSLVAPYTHPNTDKLLPGCEGAGVAALVRAEWFIVFGPISGLALHAQFDGQQTHCVLDTGRVEPDTARPITRSQYWTLIGASVGAMFAWR